MMMLSAQQLCCAYAQQTLFQPINFSLTAGTVLQIVGSNGCGKSTLLRCLAQLHPIAHGTLRWQQQALININEAYQQQLLYIGHQLGLKAELSILENIDYWLTLMQHSSSTYAIQQVLQQWQLSKQQHRPLQQCSQGQRQRCALLRLQLYPATLWLLDEPFAALDNHARLQLMNCIKQHCAQGGIVILSTHHPLSDWETLAVQPC